MKLPFKISFVLSLLIPALFITKGIKIDDNGADLLPDGRVKAQFETLNRLGLVNRLFIVLRSDESGPEGAIRLQDAVEKTGRQLEANGNFRDVIFRLPDDFQEQLIISMEEHYPALFTETDLALAREKITEKGINRAVREIFSIINSPAGFMAAHLVSRDPLGFILTKLRDLQKLEGNLKVILKKGFFTNSSGEYLIMAESRLPLTDSASAEHIKEILDDILSSTLTPDMTCTITGSLEHTVANEKTIKRDLKILLPAASILLALIFMLAFREPRSLLITLIPMFAALPAIACALLFTNNISGLGLGFGIVLMGIGVDFAIHIHAARIHEDDGHKRILKPLLMALATTMTGFAILMMSAVPVHRQMALLGFTGILFASIFSWLLVPELPPPSKSFLELAEKFEDRRFRFRQTGRKAAIGVWLFLLLSGILCWPHMKYDGDISRIDGAPETVKKADRLFREKWGNNKPSAFIVSTADTLSGTLDINDQVWDTLCRRGIIGIQSPAPFVPGPIHGMENMARWQTFTNMNRERIKSALLSAAAKYGFRSDAFRPFFEWLEKPAEKFDPENMISGPLRPMLVPFIRQDKSGCMAVTIAPDNKEATDLPEILEQTGRGTLSIISPSAWKDDVGRLLKRDIIRLAGVAALAVLCLCLIFFGNMRSAAAAMAPVLAALAAMSVYSAISGTALNMMHLLMAIMVTGLSVDYGIFTTCFFRADSLRGKHSLLPVTLCALSTLSGFGVLALAAHPALSSLGITVLTGIGAAWPAAIVVTPAILDTKKGAE